VNDLIDTTEMYLRTIFELEEEGIVPLRARIAERLHQSGPTVSQTVARMERDGLLTVEGDRHLQLSDEGRQLATAVMRKHRLAECLLVDVIGLDYADVHEEACRWEHVMSENVERRLLALLGNPTVSPFGNPIPGLDALRGGEPLGGETSAVLDSLTLLSATATPKGRVVVVRRISEQLQENTELLRQLDEQGVRPGATMTARLVGGAVELDGSPLPAGVAQHLFVTAEDDELSPLEAAQV
jgi:DtxR family Mn-dependent transcriptional regulator